MSGGGGIIITLVFIIVVCLIIYCIKRRCSKKLQNTNLDHKMHSVGHVAQGEDTTTRGGSEVQSFSVYSYANI